MGLSNSRLFVLFPKIILLLFVYNKILSYLCTQFLSTK